MRADTVALFIHSCSPRVCDSICPSAGPSTNTGAGMSSWQAGDPKQQRSSQDTHSVALEALWPESLSTPREPCSLTPQARPTSNTSPQVVQACFSKWRPSPTLWRPGNICSLSQQLVKAQPWNRLVKNASWESPHSLNSCCADGFFFYFVFRIVLCSFAFLTERMKCLSLAIF